MVVKVQEYIMIKKLLISSNFESEVLPQSSPFEQC